MCTELNTNIEVIVGTYEEFLLGYKLCFSPSSKIGYSLQTSFTNHGHTASVRSLASSTKHLASGGADETIRLFNMKTRQEVGTLIQHDGTVTCMEFLDSSHLVSGSEDGTICVWTTNNWQCVKTLRGHKDGIISLSAHPTGKLLLSIGKDKTLRTWNLIKGRSAYVTNIKAVGEFVLWSPDGSKFLVSLKNRIDVYSVKTTGIIHSIDFGRRASCATFLNDHVLVVGGESNKLELHDITRKCALQMFEAHKNRIKGLYCVRNFGTKQSNSLVLSTSSDGFIKVWKFKSSKLDEHPSLLTKLDTTCRLTCLTMLHIVI
ncbi:p21-activated protein kinase-interacting protein 1-like isoform X2 [Limulus polyphemus]|uniref:P21-activated protein kinase-interacting protein 1-like isoform X2 n=1 Tax=Limulus polyphemus TaxID=6850 RepID=A0ABM1SM01_LIMPO|nr:p21-activated protein kinase-interacting protein 1-like isoform X2 [Limulus polyphemus]